jgi:hypothetical protein
MHLAGEFEDTFCGSSLSRVYVGEDSDVSVFAEVRHNNLIVRFCVYRLFRLKMMRLNTR